MSSLSNIFFTCVSKGQRIIYDVILITDMLIFIYYDTFSRVDDSTLGIIGKGIRIDFLGEATL